MRFFIVDVTLVQILRSALIIFTLIRGDDRFGFFGATWSALALAIYLRIFGNWKVEIMYIKNGKRSIFNL